MKKMLILLAVLFTIVPCLGQRGADPCSGNIYTFTDNPKSEVLDLFGSDNLDGFVNLDSFITKFVSTYFPDCLYFITTDKSGLIEIPLKTALDDYVCFAAKERNVSIEMERIWKDVSLLTDSLEVVELLEDDVMVGKIFNKPFYGNVWVRKNDTTYTISRIAKIEVALGKDTVSIDNNLFNDLFCPNFHHKYKSFRPIEAYYSLNTNLIFIYFYGDFPNLLPNDDYFDGNSSFLCKLITEPNGATHRIVIPTKYLSYYGWIACEDFWGF